MLRLNYQWLTNKHRNQWWYHQYWWWLYRDQLYFEWFQWQKLKYWTIMWKEWIKWITLLQNPWGTFLSLLVIIQKKKKKYIFRELSLIIYRLCKRVDKIIVDKLLNFWLSPTTTTTNNHQPLTTYHLPPQLLLL